MARRARPAAVVLLLALLVVAALLVVPGPWSPPLDRSAGAGGRDQGPAGVPDRMAGYSYLTGSVSASPPGRSLALWQQGHGVETADFPQALVLAADDDEYRRVDLAERRAGPESQGDPAPMLLSADGGSVAVGVHDDRAADVALLDLATGDVGRFAVPGARSVVPVAWSPDSRRLVYLTDEEPSNPHLGNQLVGVPGLLDVGSGQVRPLVGGASAKALAVAFAPDGERLAVQWSGRAGVEVLSTAGRRLGEVPIGAGQRLAGPQSWSPDGRLLAVVPRTTPGGAGPGGSTLSFVPVGGGAAPALRPLPVDLGPGGGLLGWTSPTEVVLDGARSAAGSTPDHRVAAVDLRTGEQRALTSVPTGGNYDVSRFQLASALLPDLAVRPAGDAGRGPWPLWLQLGVLLLVVGLVLLVRRSSPEVRRVHLHRP